MIDFTKSFGRSTLDQTPTCPSNCATIVEAHCIDCGAEFANAENAAPTLLSLAEALPQLDEHTAQYSDRSSAMNVIMTILRKLPSDMALAIIADLQMEADAEQHRIASTNKHVLEPRPHGIDEDTGRSCKCYACRDWDAKFPAED